MTGRPFHRFVRCAFAALLLLVLGLAAHAAPTSWIEFSVDGRSWSRTSPSAVFAEDIVLVPGDSASGALHLRSAAESTGFLTVSIVNVAASPSDAAEAFDLAIVSDTGEGFGRTGLHEITGADGPVAAYSLEPGESVALTVTVGLDTAITGSIAQNSAIGLDLKVTFIDAQALPGGNGAPQSSAPSQAIPLLPPSHSQGPPEQAPQEIAEDRRIDPATNEGTFVHGPLAVTGITGGAALLIAAMLLTGGVLALAMRRRRDRT